MMDRKHGIASELRGLFRKRDAVGVRGAPFQALPHQKFKMRIDFVANRVHEAMTEQKMREASWLCASGLAAAQMKHPTRPIGRRPDHHDPAICYSSHRKVVV